MGLPIINCVWIGDQMGPVHAACLQSFLDTDHKVVLHSYEEVKDAPRGVSRQDANRLLPKNKLLTYANGGSYALSANLIRYQIQRHNLGLYVDCDVYCLRPMQDEDYIFGWEDVYAINCAVLKLPADNPATLDLASIQEGWVPPWIKGAPKPLNEYPWGTTGPRALTHYLQAHGLDTKAKPSDILYPLHNRHWQLLFDPELTIGDISTSRTHYIHLWSKFSHGTEFPEGSPLWRIVRSVQSSQAKRIYRAVRRRVSGVFHRP